MDHKPTPASRLIIVFILAIILSGSILTYFSINNISNLKELTEKRIIEEQREIYAGFSAALQNKIDTITAGLISEDQQSSLTKDSLVDRAAEFDFIIQPFILNSTGRFLFPDFAGIPQTLPEAKSSEEFMSAFRKGEVAEFTEENLARAKRLFLACLGLSTGVRDSVKAINALGRVAVKLNDAEDALKRYRLIISDYHTESDENGIPYAYYSLQQLMKITGVSNPEEILRAVKSCLEKMETGSIPLNYNTEELLNLVMDWLLQNDSHNQRETATINELILSLQQQIRFIAAYGNELSELLKKGSIDNYFMSGNNYKVINSVSGSNKEFFLINTDPDSTSGFLIDRGKLLDNIAKSYLQSGLEFDYIIDFPTSYNQPDATGNRLVHTSQLNPYFPGQFMEIKLSDETLIDDIVSRRAWIYGIASLLLLGAMMLGVVLILRDIAREKHLARLRADFISNVTHELKTPLTSIRMYAESLILGRVKSLEGQKEYLSVMVNETDRLKRMINNILEYSKMEKGKPEYHFVRTNLASLVRETMNEMKYWFEREQFAVTTDLDEDMFAEVDSEKLKQAVGNLLSNAIKYSADIKEVSVRLYREHDKVGVEVADRGIGIAEEELSRIFEEFYRVEQREGASGTGLGLTVVKEIVEAHSGEITVTSELGKGSKFVIMLNQQSGRSENNPGN